MQQMKKRRTIDLDSLTIKAKEIINKADGIYVGNLKYWLSIGRNDLWKPLTNNQFKIILDRITNDGFIVQDNLVFKRNSKRYQEYLKRNKKGGEKYEGEIKPRKRKQIKKRRNEEVETIHKPNRRLRNKGVHTKKSDNKPTLLLEDTSIKRKVPSNLGKRRRRTCKTHSTSNVSGK